MVVRVAINGFGRIGRMFFKAAVAEKSINIVAINDLADAKMLAHLLKYDSVHGIFKSAVSSTKNALIVDKKKIPIFSERQPSALPWKQYKVDVVVESTGFFTRKADALQHIQAGAKKVLLSAPPKDKADLIIVQGVNNQKYQKKKHTICSNASCTTNSLAPVVKVLHETFGIKHGLLTTVHSYTADQRLVDGPHKDMRRARHAALNIVPTTTGAAQNVAEVIPVLKGKLDGIAFRVPTANGSVTDFVCEVKKDVTVKQINAAFLKASKTSLKRILSYTELPLVSSDIIGNPHSAIIDGLSTSVVDKRMLRVVAWYDNEWGFSNRMIDVIKQMV